ncbi:MAG: DUF6029 family protein, partial [Myxococcota bacterium]|nr:DUF6029 family protein [Myxococcota bacterium]
FGKFSMGLGDDYVSFGRGMALSLRKVDELGFDVTLRGGHVQWKSRLFSARAHVGLTNVTNVDGVDEKKVPDPLDLVTAIRLEARPLQSLLRGFRVGAHVVDVERRHSQALEALSPIVPGGIDQSSSWSFGDKFIRSVVAGGSIEAPRIAKTVGLYAEANVLQNTNTRVNGDGNSSGLAIYGSATTYLGPVTVLAEAKHYENYDLRSTLHPDTANATGSISKDFTYIAPPTLERKDQRWANNSSVDGAHLQVDARLPDGGGRLFVSDAGFQHGPQREEITAHVYGGWEGSSSKGNRLVAQAGWRTDRHPGDDQTRLRMFHLDLDAYLLVAAGHDLQLHWAHEFRSTDLELESQRDDYMEGTSYITWTIAPSWSITAQFEYLTSKKEDNPIFPGGYLQYRFTRDSFIRLFAGRGKGGLKCSGGVCRIFPDFEGARLEATARF